MKKIVDIILVLALVFSAAVNIYDFVKIKKLKDELDSKTVSTDTVKDAEADAVDYETESFVDELNRLSADSEFDLSSEFKERCTFLEIDENGFGVCVYDLESSSMYKEMGYIATTKNNGKSWKEVEKIHGQCGFDQFVLCDKKLYLLKFHRISGGGNVSAFDLTTEKWIEYDDCYVEGLQFSDGLSKNVKPFCITKTDDGMTVGWIKHIDKKEYNVVYMAEYDFNMNEKKCLYKDETEIERLQNS